MRWLSVFSVVLFAGSLTGLTAEHGTGKQIIDLSYAFSEDTVYWPTAEGFSLRVDSAGLTEAGYYYAANSFFTAEHGGTHLDAPVHFAEGMPSVEEISLDRLLGPAVLVDVQDRALEDSDYQVQVEDFTSWEGEYGTIPTGSIVLLRTGWGRYYPDKKKYLGTDRSGVEALPDLSFPGLDPRAAQWLVEHREISAIGLDTASIDRGQSTMFEAHQILFKAGIPVFENVANLGCLPETGFEIIALPMKIKGGSGAPLRIVAILP